MMYVEKLQESAENCGNILCMGIDPVLEMIPLKGRPENIISKFYLDILGTMEAEQVMVASIKPNIAFFEAYGIAGLRALRTIIKGYKRKGVSIILDAKRGDVGKTARAYAKSIFGYWDVDATTVAPYLGSDCVHAFAEYDRGVYVLVRTSNKSAVEIQDLESEGRPIYRHVAEKIIEWHRPGLGAVVGATYPDELRQLSSFFVSSGKKVPLLIPGVGAQGASAEDVLNILDETDNPRWLHRINSSSAINYAYLEEETDDYAGAAVRKIKSMMALINS